MKREIKALMFILVGIFLISLVSAQISYCCEKTTYGAWCQNEDEDKCDSNFQKSPTSCEASSYCREGCCYNSQEGNCMENTPQKVCNENGGQWNANANCEVPQCELGCCLIGSQAAFVTQTRCKRLSNLYGLEISFRTEIASETECILSATSEVEGACVFTKDFEMTCKRLTQKQCDEMKSKGEEGGFFSFFSSGNDEPETTVDFYPGKLCTDEELGTNCAPSTKTTCVEGEDAVFYTDTCGNIANVYDAGKYEDKNYWAEILDVAESCGYGTDGNPNSRTCGNCDYFLGSTCKQYERGIDAGAPNYGDYICRDLSCNYQGKKYEHGESFCAVFSDGDLTLGEDSDFNEDDLIEKNLPGSRYFRLLCYNSEILVEPCADFRNEVCLQDDIEGFQFAACRVNRWQECIAQNEQKDCENSDKRDCIWSGGNCYPRYAPGFDFWQGEDGQDICAQADEQCDVIYEKRIGEDWECEENCECKEDSWAKDQNEKCMRLGDCGIKSNILGYDGFYGIKDLFKVGSIKKE